MNVVSRMRVNLKKKSKSRNKVLTLMVYVHCAYWRFTASAHQFIFVLRISSELEKASLPFSSSISFSRLPFVFSKQAGAFHFTGDSVYYRTWLYRLG